MIWLPRVRQTPVPLAKPRQSREPSLSRSDALLNRTCCKTSESRRGEQGPSEGQERWLYWPAFQSRVDADANTWTFDLLSCEPRPPAWTAVTHQAEFVFDSGGILAAVNVTRSTLPLDPGG